MTPQHEQSILLKCSNEKEDIQHILNILKANLKEPSLLGYEISNVLERLRYLTANSVDLHALCTSDAVSIICRYGFAETANHIALRCLCNTLLRSEAARHTFINGDYQNMAMDLMKSDRFEDEFLSARLLLLCTYETALRLNALFEKGRIADIINANLSRHGKYITDIQRGFPSAPSVNAACNECLKLLSNLAALCPEKAPLFQDSLYPILKMLETSTIPSPPLEPPISSLINCLVYLTSSTMARKQSVQNILFPPSNNSANVNRLVHILDLATQVYSDDELDGCGSPILQVILQIAEIATFEPRAYLQACLLPSVEDRNEALGSGTSLPARLLRMSTSITANRLRQLIPSLLFELSDKNVRRFVYNIGYGYASGFLVSRGIGLPQDVTRNIAEEVVEDKNNIDVNLVTGQRRDMEPELHMPEMTDEEKEREAERLFVLFERLRGTGVVNIENPVAQAARDGRLEDLD